MSKETKQRYEAAKQDHKIALNFACQNLQNPNDQIRKAAISGFTDSTKTYHEAKIAHCDDEVKKVETAVRWTIIGWFSFVVLIIIASIFGSDE